MDKDDAYLKCFNDVINSTSTKESPWYVLPGDQRWYTRYLVTEILLDVLKSCKPEYPELPQEEKDKLPECRQILSDAIAGYAEEKTRAAEKEKTSEKNDSSRKKAKKKSKK